MFLYFWGIVVNTTKQKPLIIKYKNVIMKFVKLNGWVEDSSFISLGIENGDNCESIGDQIWISKDGTEMEVYESADKDVLQEAMDLFEGNSKRAFKGALMRMGVCF